MWVWFSHNQRHTVVPQSTDPLCLSSCCRCDRRLEQGGTRRNWCDWWYSAPDWSRTCSGGLPGCNGVVRFVVVEQDIRPSLRARLDLDEGGNKAVFFRLGGESDLRTLESGHIVIWADPFATGGWHPPPQIISRHEKMHDSCCAPQINHVIIEAGRLRAERRTNQHMTTTPAVHLAPKDRHELPRTFPRKHHVRTTVANRSREFALRNPHAKLRGRRMSLNGLFVRERL